MVTSYTKLFYVCICDNCKKVHTVEKDLNNKIYNRAQAVRSIGWSFGEDGKTVMCDRCRFDNYRKVKNKWLNV